MSSWRVSSLGIRKVITEIKDAKDSARFSNFRQEQTKIQQKTRILELEVANNLIIASLNPAKLCQLRFFIRIRIPISFSVNHGIFAGNRHCAENRHIGRDTALQIQRK